MGKIDALKDRRVYLDTNAIVYAAEYEIDAAAEELRVAVSYSHEIFGFIDQGKVIGVTSELTLAEVLVGALKNNRQRLADYYRRFLSADGPLDMVPVSRTIWELSAKLRAEFLVKGEKLMMPDAVQLSAAIHEQCNVFICNDKSLCNKANATGRIEGFFLGKNEDQKTS